ncbi:hypothetical protein Tco_0740033 [Tanacetum coccineum]
MHEIHLYLRSISCTGHIKAGYLTIVIATNRTGKSETHGCGGSGSVDVVSVVAVKLEGTPADAVRALKKLVFFRLSTTIL